MRLQHAAWLCATSGSNGCRLAPVAPCTAERQGPLMCRVASAPSAAAHSAGHRSRLLLLLPQEVHAPGSFLGFSCSGPRQAESGTPSADMWRVWQTAGDVS